MKFVTSPRYVVDMGGHVFATAKFPLIREELIKQNLAKKEEFLEPQPASRQDLELAHSREWVDKILEGKLGFLDEVRMEIPYSPELAFAHRLQAQGTVEACRLALSDGLGIHIGGGFHHAMPDHGEGFCVFNDIAVGILKMIEEGRIERAAVVDLDVHQGNGTAVIFSGRKEVFTFSMHQKNIYPPSKPRGSLDIALEDGTGDVEYLRLLSGRLPGILNGHSPDLVVYQAGADCYEGDLLGGLNLTFEGLRRRDNLVFSECFRMRIPVAVTLGGGYAKNTEDTVNIHVQTITEACTKKLESA